MKNRKRLDNPTEVEAKRKSRKIREKLDRLLGRDSADVSMLGDSMEEVEEDEMERYRVGRRRTRKNK